jgi:hypothetical protein
VSTGAIRNMAYTATAFIIGGMLFDITNAKGLEMLPWYIYGTVAFVSMPGFIKFKEERII